MQDPLTSIAAILALGAAAQWIAWRLRLPGILLLLVFGFFSGTEWLGLVDPEALLGKTLHPFIGAAVALILFEGGLTLHLRELKDYGGIVWRLCSIGALVTWAGCTLAARFLAGMSWDISILLGAILIVSGPTVVLPILRQINVKGAAGAVLKWEGIAIDPVGAVIAVLTFEGLAQGSLGSAAGHGVLGIVRTIAVGAILGVLGGWLLMRAIERYWIPDHLDNPIALALTVGVFALSNYFQHESGLLAVTVMGVFAANQSAVSVKHILEFKENIRVLLISSLFILLAANLKRADIALLNGRHLLFLGALIFVVRPLAVWASTWRTGMSTKERLFLAWLCPRGIVAAAVASIFAAEIINAGDPYPDAKLLVPLTFLVIVGTVVIYGLTSGIVARKLGLAVKNPQGILIVGAHAWAREIALAIRGAGIDVMVADTNRERVAAARLAGLSAFHGNVLEPHMEETLPLQSMGRVFALTPNDEVNTLISLHFIHEFGRAETYQLARDAVTKNEGSSHLRGRILFGEKVDYFDISRRFGRKDRVVATRLSDRFTFDDFLAHHGEQALPLLLISESGAVDVFTTGTRPEAQARHTIVAIVPQRDESAPGATAEGAK